MPTIDTQIDNGTLINADINSPEINPITVETTQQPIYPVEPKVAETRAFKASYALQDVLKKSYEEIYGDFLAGKEPDTRQIAASEIDMRKSRSAQNAIVRLATAKQGPLSREEADGIKGIVSKLSINTNPETVLEEAYGKQFINLLEESSARQDSEVWKQAQRDNPQELQTLREQMGMAAAKRELVLDKHQQLEDRYNKQGWLRWGYESVISSVPFVEEYLSRNRVKGTEGSVDPAKAMEQQRLELYRSPDLDTFKRQLDQAVDPIADTNLQTAKKFTEDMLGMSSDSMLERRVADIINLTGFQISGKTIKAIPSAVKGITKDVKTMVNPADVVKLAPDKPIEQVEKAMVDVVQAAGDPNATKSKMLEAVGDISEAAIAKATTAVEKREKGVSDFVERSIEPLFSGFRLDREQLQAGAGKSRELTERILSNYDETTAALIKAQVESVKVERLPEIFTTEVGLRAVKDGMKYTYPYLRNNILDISAPFRNPWSNTYFVGIDIGRQGAVPFKTKWVAQTFKNHHNIDGEIIQEGLGFYIRTYKPINETSDWVRNLIANTETTTIPFKGWLGSWLSKIRTSEDVLSLAERQNRKVATNAANLFLQVMDETVKPIKELKGWTGLANKQRWKDFTKVLDNARDMPDPDNPMLKGYFFKDVEDFTTHYHRWVGRLPDEQSVEAYFAFKQGMEIDRFMRNIAEHRNKSRVGAETHKISSVDAKGARVQSPEFAGIVRNKFPGGDDTIMVMGKKLGEERYYRMGDASRPNKPVLDKLREQVEKGELKLIEVYDPDSRPLSGFGLTTDNERVRYIAAPAIETRSLDWNHVLRRGGGHVEYDYNWYIKQANIRDEVVGYGKDAVTRKWYDGDNTVMPIDIRSKGIDLADRLDQLRRLIKAGKIDDAKEYSNRFMPEEWDEVYSWFKESVGPEGKVMPPRLNLNEKIQLVKKNTRIADIDNTLKTTYGDDFKDSFRQGSIANQNRVAFTGERDAWEVQTAINSGTKDMPIYRLSDADKIDPISSLNRAVNNIANSNYMEDYKVSAVEHWIKQAAQYMDAEESQLKYSPFHYFHHGEWKTAALANNAEKIRVLDAARDQINAFVGSIPGKSETLFASAKQQLADSIYAVNAKKAQELIPDWLLGKTSDPLGFARSIAFHEKLGVFNLPQFFAQSMTYVSASAIVGPKVAISGTWGAQLHFWSTINKSKPILDHLDKLASSMNIPGTSKWRPGEWKEAAETLERTGFGLVGRDYNDLNTVMSNKIIQSGIHNFLDFGLMFFKQGERNAKNGAWFMAFKEWRDKFPTRQLDNNAVQEILERADLLNNNMSRASSSMLHSGVLSIPMQFYTYTLRMAELMFSKRLTTAEKARLIGWNAAIYGAPTAIGVTGFPLTDLIRKYANENGYVIGDNFLSSLMMEGIPSSVGALISGGGDVEKGTYYNVGDRWAPKGAEPVLNLILRGDKTWWDLVGGASWSTFKGHIESLDPFFRAIGSKLRGDDKSTIMMDDVLDLFNETAGPQSARRLYTAMQTGKWLSKKETWIDDVSKTQAIFQTLSGLQDQSASDLQRMAWSIRDVSDAEKKAEKIFKREFVRWVANVESNPEHAQRYLDRAFYVLDIAGVRDTKKSTILTRAINDNKNLVDKVSYDFYMKSVKDDQRELMQQAYRNRLRIEDKKKGIE